MNPLSSFLVAVVCLMPIANLDSRNLILSLEEVLGPPPQQNASADRPKVYYSLGQEEPDPLIEEIIRKLKMGYDLLPDEQLLFDQYSQRLGVGENNAVLQPIAPEALNWVEQYVRTPSGDASALYLLLSPRHRTLSRRAGIGSRNWPANGSRNGGILPNCPPHSCDE